MRPVFWRSQQPRAETATRARTPPPRPAAAAPASRARSPAQGRRAQQAAQEAWIAGFQDGQFGRDDRLRPGRVRRRPRTVHRRRASPTAASTRHSPTKELTGARQRCGGADNLVEVPDYVSPIAVDLQPAGRRRAQARPRNAGEDLRAEDHEVERPGDRRRQPGRRPAGHPHHPGQPLRRVGHDRELHRIPLRRPRPASGRSKSAATGRSRAARPPRAPRASSMRSRRRGHDRLRRREPGRRPRRRQSQGRQRVRRADARGRGEDLRGVRAERGSRGERLHVQAQPDARRLGHLSGRARLVPDGPARTYDDANTAAIVKAYFNYMISAEGQQGGRGAAGSASAQRLGARRRSSRPWTRSAADRRRRVDGSKRKHETRSPALPGRVTAFSRPSSRGPGS